MEGNEQEEYGAELQDVIEGLRSLAREVELPPPALLTKVLTRGESLLPPPSRPVAWWQQSVMAWLRGVVALPRWGLALACACLVLLFMGSTIVTLQGAVARLQVKLDAMEDREREALEHTRQLTNLVIKQADRLGH